MAVLVAEAIEIITDDGRGIPVAYNSTAIGLATDGRFYLITDRFGITGLAAPNITGDTTRNTWYEGVLTSDYGDFAISRNADFVEAGCLESVSGFSFGIKNTGAFWSTLQANGVYLGRRRVKYYRVTSTDGLTFDFQLRWTGVIDDQPFTETTYSIQCVDVSKEIFKSLPIASVNSATFEDAPDDSQDKMIPIAMGRVAYSPLVVVSKPGEKVNLVQNGSIFYTSCGMVTYSSVTKIVQLYTLGTVFLADDDRLKDAMLTVIAGGEEQSVRILSNTATDGSQYTAVTLEEPFTITSPATFTGWSAGTTTTAMWFGEVQKLAATLISSNKPIYSIQQNTHGRPAFSSYDDNTKRFSDLSDVCQLYSETNISASGYPGLEVLAMNLDVNGDMTAFFPIAASEILLSSAMLMTYGGPAAGQSQPSLFDRDQSTGYAITAITSGAGQATFDLTIPTSVVDDAFSALYIMVDLVHNRTSGSGNPIIRISAQGKDIYGQQTAVLAGVNASQIFNGVLSTTPENVFTLHGSYYNTSVSPALFHTTKGLLDISSLIDNVRKARAFPKLLITVAFSGAADYTASLREIGLIGKRVININSEQTYMGLKGEINGTTWDGRVTAAQPQTILPHALEYLIRNYDTSAPIWQAAKAYVVGDKIRGTADTGHIFVCTVAGTSHAATEPTWTDTVGATYANGTATFKQFQEIPIDKSSFDALFIQRASWVFGRTLTEKKPSADYYKEICEHGFIVGTITPSGLVKPKAWRQNTTPSVTFDSTNILQGTIGEMRLTPVRRMYNDILIRYGWNPGSGKYNKQISVTKADQPAFPLESELLSQGTSLGTFSAIYTFYFGDEYFIIVTTNTAHGLATGAYATLTGNTHGYNFSGVVSVGSAFVFALIVAGPVFTATPSTSGTLMSVTTPTPKWKTYVTGISNYGTAKDLWDQCRASYLITMTVQKLPSSLGDCPWFIDPYAKDANGVIIWTDLDVGDDHAAVFYAQNLVAWSAWQKKQITFEVIDNAANSALGLADPIYLNDAKQTGGLAVLGWIHEKAQLPRTDKLPERFRFGVTLNPESMVEIGIIDEMGATDIIDEMTATDIIDEVRP